MDSHLIALILDHVDKCKTSSTKSSFLSSNLALLCSALLCSALLCSALHMADSYGKANVETLVLHYLGVYEVTDDVVGQIRQDSERFGLGIEQILKVMGSARWAKKGAYCMFQYTKPCFSPLVLHSFGKNSTFTALRAWCVLMIMLFRPDSLENGSVISQRKHQPNMSTQAPTPSSK